MHFFYYYNNRQLPIYAGKELVVKRFVFAEKIYKNYEIFKSLHVFFKVLELSLCLSVTKRVSMWLTERYKTAQNLVDNRKN